MSSVEQPSEFSKKISDCLHSRQFEFRWDPNLSKHEYISYYRSIKVHMSINLFVHKYIFIYIYIAMSDTYSCSLLLFQNVPIQPSSNLFISPCSYPSLHQFIHGNNCQSIHLSNKSRSQEALEVPLGQVQNRRLLRTDRLTIALEDDVILASKLAMMHSGQKS